MVRAWHRRVSRHAPLVFLLLSLWSCADNREPEPVVVPLQHDPELSVRMTFGGRTAWFMFDTGAGAHTLARWFVDAAGMTIDDSLREAVRGRDAGGEPVEVSVVRNVEGRLPDRTTLILESAIVADFPPEFQQEEFGGLLNPQLLAGDDRAVVLDLRVPEFRIEDVEQAAYRFGADALGGDQVQSCSSTDAPVPNLVHAVLVAARDQKAWLQLDTGSGKTAIVAGHPLVAGLPLVLLGHKIWERLKIAMRGC
jgi:hypothetical protein